MGEGKLLEQNYEEAFKFFKLSADQGFTRALNNVAIFYMNGTGVEKNEEEAFKIFNNLADTDSKAKLNLAICYSRGVGVEQNVEEAIRLFKILADGGSDKAKQYLEICYKHQENKV